MRARVLGRNVSSHMGFVVVRFLHFCSEEFKNGVFAVFFGERGDRHEYVENHLSPSEVV